MESALQVDLARPEATAEQILDSALGTISAPRSLNEPVPESTHPNVESNPSIIRGGVGTTAQARLTPKSGKDTRSQTVSAQEAAVEGFDLDNYGESSRAHVLQPTDEGFGAWSYVASAFAMFIVVWGKPRAISC